MDDKNVNDDQTLKPVQDDSVGQAANDSSTPAEQADEETLIDAAETPEEQAMSEEETTPANETATEEASPAKKVVNEELSAVDEVEVVESGSDEDKPDEGVNEVPTDDVIHSDDPNVKWYVVHTYSGHENKVATALKQRVESEHLEHKIMDVLVPTQEKIEIRSGKKATVKEKIFPGYILVKMNLDDASWLAVRTTQGVTSFVGIGNKPTPIPEAEVRTIVKYMSEGAAPTFKDVFIVDDTVKIIDGPFSEFIGKVDSVDKEHGKVRVLVSIFGRETPVELDFLQVQKL